MYAIRVRKTCGKVFDTGVSYSEAAAAKKVASWQKIYNSKGYEVFSEKLDRQ